MDSVGQRRSFPEQARGRATYRSVQSDTLQPLDFVEFLDLQETEQKNTSLSQRVRQVVILAVGAVWKSKYELYAHAAAARKAGISEDAIRMLTTGGLPDELRGQA